MTIEINSLPDAFKNEELVKSGVVSKLAQIGPVFDVIIPFVVKNLDDCAPIAFEMIVGHPLKNYPTCFQVTIKNIEFIDPKDATVCFPIFELLDFPDVAIVNEYVKRFGDPRVDVANLSDEELFKEYNKRVPAMCESCDITKEIKKQDA